MMQERSLYISVEKINRFFSKIILLYGIFIFDRIDAVRKGSEKYACISRECCSGWKPDSIEKSGCYHTSGLISCLINFL